MSATTMNYILGEDVIITPDQVSVLADFEVIKSLDLFPKEMWSDVGDIEISHFGKWCHQVLTFDYFKLFHVDVNNDDNIREVSFAFAICTIVYLFYERKILILLTWTTLSLNGVLTLASLQKLLSFANSLLTRFALVQHSIIVLLHLSLQNLKLTHPQKSKRNQL